MIRNIIPATLTLMAVSLPASAAEIRIESGGPVVELTISETVQSVPDLALIGAGVQTRAASAREAVRQNAAAMDRVVTRIRALGIPAKDIQTSNFSLNPEYRYDRESEQQVFTGYQVTNQVSVKLRDMKRTGEVLDALVEAGANNLYGPSFMLENDEQAKAEARSAAFRRGQALAGDYARMAGYSGVRLLEISESFQSFAPGPQPLMAKRLAADVAEAATPVEPGEVGTGVTVSVKFALE